MIFFSWNICRIRTRFLLTPGSFFSFTWRWPGPGSDLPLKKRIWSPRKNQDLDPILEKPPDPDPQPWLLLPGKLQNRKIYQLFKDTPGSEGKNMILVLNMDKGVYMNCEHGTMNMTIWVLVMVNLVISPFLSKGSFGYGLQRTGSNSSGKTPDLISKTKNRIRNRLENTTDPIKPARETGT